MKQLRVLQVVFNTFIKNYEIPAFRGAIIKKAGRDNILFHNHLSDEKFSYNYPLIQYKMISHKPSIICLDYGVDEIHKFFENRDWSIEISDRKINLSVDKINLNSFTMQVWDKKWLYTIREWIALNQVNYLKYEELESVVEKIQFLERILKGNILSFAKGIEWNVDKNIELSITEFREPRKIKMKKNTLLAFSLDFKCNVFIPNFIGLGKGVSSGYGIVHTKIMKNNE